MMDLGLRDSALAWRRDGRAGIVVEVVEAEGSVPREAGTRMLVSRDGVVGTIGGGHLELQAIEQARRALAGDALPRTQRLALGPALGQCCGGTVTLRWLPLADAAPESWPEPAPRFTLQIYGAGHVGRAIVRLLDGIACRVQWIDERDSEFPGAPNAPHIERVCVEPVEAEVRVAPPGAYYLVLTHSHDLDLAITGAILERGDFGYLGLIGSKTKRARFAHRFEQRGVAAELIDRIVCPIGVPGIDGKEPEVIAVAVVAQLLQHADRAAAGAQRPPAVSTSGDTGEASAPSSGGYALADELRTIEQARLRALVDGDLPTAYRLHADDFQLVTPGGRAFTRDAYLGKIERGVLRYLRWDPGPMQVRVDGRSALLRYQAELVLDSGDGTGTPLTCWHLDGYEWRDGRWQVVWSQATAVKPED